MAEGESELARRERVAREAIIATLGTDSGEYGATLFSSHHLEELDEAYWHEHLKVTKPEPAQVLGLLQLKSHWSDEDDEGLDRLDFGLPGDVSDYLLCVSFDEGGVVEDIAMES